MIRRSLNQLEARLPCKHFFRANRQYIINLHDIENVNTAISGNLELEMSNKMIIEMSRRQTAEFKDLTKF